MKNIKGESFLLKLYWVLVCALPAVLFFSYYPLIRLGRSESMNFELSLPVLWLVVFDVVAVIVMIKKRLLFKKFGRKWLWLLFPGFLTMSLLWSLNSLRGLLTVGILWMIYFALYAFFSLKGVLKEMGVKEKFWKVFFGSSLVVCVWCIIQCILDIVGVLPETSLLCAGCTYEMFGFPHPNGFAIEPQFMGNLLLAPCLVSGVLATRYFSGMLKVDQDKISCVVDDIPISRKMTMILFFIFAATMFLTFSRGAIYAFIVAMIVVVIMEGVRQKTWKVGKVFLIIVFAFLFTLNLQGIMSQLSPTSDTYGTGVAKVLNQLSLGVVDIRREDKVEDEKKLEEERVDSGVSENGDEEKKEQAVFDGYVAESTETRKYLTSSALEIWKKDFSTAMFGVGLGGAGQALYVNGFSSTPREIVQNQYASILLETGLVGVALLILTLALVMRVVYKASGREIVFTLLLAYGVSVCFFSGLPNALHIYLLPAILIVILNDGKNSYRK